MKRLAILATAILTIGVGLQAKEMTHRLGVGPKVPFYGSDVQSVGVHYSPNQNYQIVGALGLNTQTGSSALGLQGGVRRILFEEKNLNFFVGGALGLVSQETNGHNNSGFELLATTGAEFFFQGLENLGFNMEVGLGVSSLASSNRFFTLAASPFTAGMIFYF